MKITIIRTAKPDFAWEKQYTSEAFAQAMAAYVNAGIGVGGAGIGAANADNGAGGAGIEAAKADNGAGSAGIKAAKAISGVGNADMFPAKKLSTSGRPVYVGPERYCRETAEMLFENLGLSEQSQLIVTKLLQEVPFDSSPYASRTLSLSAWQQKAWLQRFFKGMFDKKSESRARAAELIAGIRAAGKNCIIIADEHMVNTLARELKRNGFHIKRGGLFHVDYLERIVATDNEPHCGGCMHDCPLSNPGCMIGKDKAAKLRSSKQIG